MRNLTDKQYKTFVTSSTTADEYWPGAPRTFSFSLRYHFE